jgi:hypothetical protein
MKLISLILSLPTENATIRMRAWRSLKALGAAVLRDGVYLMPDRESCQLALEAIAADVIAGGGSAYVLCLTERPSGDGHFNREALLLFDRSSDYATLLADVSKARLALTQDTVQEVLKQTRKLRKHFHVLAEIDYFPAEAQKQTHAALEELELAASRVLSPDEPRSAEGMIPRLLRADYQGRLWATRRRPWVDRLASAWLIRRFIDSAAQLLWLETPQSCPQDALGFDFDHATFSHVGNKVTFEVLLSSFALEEDHALQRLAALVHYLDVGGVQPAEAAGVESILAGLRDAISNDDQLLATASSVFDGLLAAFQSPPSPQEVSL